MQENQQQNKINNLIGRVLNKYGEVNLIDTYHFLMVHYGYIPFEDFKKMDANLVDELVLKINEMNKKQNKSGNSRRVGRR